MRLVLLTLLLAASASAQTPADSTEVGRIVGMVTDAETGDPLIGANVYLPDVQRGAPTNIEGQYQILGLPEGNYAVQISYTGYHTIQDSARVGAGTTTTLPVTLLAVPIEELTVCCWHGPPLIPWSAYTARRVRYSRPSEPSMSYIVRR